MLSIWFHSHFSGMKGYPAAHGWYLSLRLEALAEPMDEVEDIRAAGHPCQNPELLVLGQMGMTVHTQWHGEQTKWRWGMLASSSRTQSELRPWNRALLHTNNGQQHPTANSEPWSRGKDLQKIVVVYVPTSSKPSTLPGAERWVWVFTLFTKKRPKDKL